MKHLAELGRGVGENIGGFLGEGQFGMKSVVGGEGGGLVGVVSKYSVVIRAMRREVGDIPLIEYVGEIVIMILEIRRTCGELDRCLDGR